MYQTKVNLRFNRNLITAEIGRESDFAAIGFQDKLLIRNSKNNDIRSSIPVAIKKNKTTFLELL